MRFPFVIQASESLNRLLFPPVCVLCEEKLKPDEAQLCLYCEADLPYSRHYRQLTNNEMHRSLGARFGWMYAGSLLYFTKEGPVRKILHEIKYRNREELAREMGLRMGRQLLTACLNKPDALVAVPLHPNKLKKRGFNQSQRLASAISEVVRIPQRTDLLVRDLDLKSQTKLGRSARWENISQAFSALPEARGLHIALVDDMVTTGSTLEACTLALDACGAAAVSVFSLAYEAGQ